MDLGLHGKRVLVTGASQGIGLEIAKAFAHEGCKLTLLARREDALREAVKSLHGQGHDFVAVDLMEDGAPTAVTTSLLEKHGRFDVAVHNIGGVLGVKDPFAPVEDWERVWRFNAGIAIEMNRLLVPPMREQKWGRIVHISSISGESLRGSAAYGVAKAYVSAYTKAFGRAVAEDGIVVSALLPGAIYAEGGHWDENSDINKNNQEAFFKKRSDFLRHHHAVGRLGLAEEIAPFALFMASKYATFAQGSLVPIDGGTM